MIRAEQVCVSVLGVLLLIVYMYLVFPLGREYRLDIFGPLLIIVQVAVFRDDD